MTDTTERRRNPRYKIGPIVRIILPEGEAISGTIQNISRGGMLVALSVELELERTYQIEVPDSQGVFCLLGEALRLHLPPRSADRGQVSRFRVGFEFVGIDAATGERLSRLLEEVAA